ncbi:venom dipeptidyl peptidase 4 isoform X2 [Diabrotica undecimpunctata]|uniref:venom dipeptidyl peptidase 4 isoform X2 n=1 Tax=Diabrotica undecimpunctata TaxID=50387 RepID=UPI003B637A4B
MILLFPVRYRFRKKVLFLLVAILTVIVLGIVALTQQRSIKEIDRQPFELDDFLNHTYSALSFNGSWISDSAFMYKTFENDVLLFNMSTKSIDLFLDQKVLAEYPTADLSLSPDRSYVLLKYNVSAVFRHSITALYTIYDVAQQKFYHLANQNPLQLVEFSPEGHGLVYVFENNIYYIDDFSKDIENPVAVTVIGIPGVLYCGVPDWVYEEEVLASGSALWFSPDGAYLAYAVFNDEQVYNLSYTIYGEPGSPGSQYPHEAVIRYPKSGTPNPIARIYLYDIVNKKTKEIQIPLHLSNVEPNDFIFYGLTWISAEELSLVCTNRVQNKSSILRCSTNGSCEEEVSQTESKGWITPIVPIYSKNGTKRLEVLPQPEGDDRYDHLVLTDVKTKTAKRLTHGKFSVLSIIAWNEDTGLIYYSATSVDCPSQQNSYSVDESGNISCLTCFFTIDETPCRFGTLIFSTELSYYVKMCLGPQVPLVGIENTKDSEDILIWEDNFILRIALAYKLHPKVRDLVVPINDEFSARVRLLLPPNLDESSNKKYPAIIDTYGGPGNNQINDAYNVQFKHYLVTKREYIYIYIDGRGSGRDGYNKMFDMYRRFGTVEVEDQIQITKYLQEHLPYIDAQRTGIWGWSYGGFCSSWALAKDKDHVFKAALSVAPVTSFIYYDSIYTERFMGLPTPEDNEQGYNNTDLTNAVEAFRGRNYFIIHGTGDDNVHYQNSMILVKALELADIDFRQHSYPDENHSLGHVSRHLYHMMDKYWADQFGVKNPTADAWSAKGANVL